MDGDSELSERAEELALRRAKREQVEQLKIKVDAWLLGLLAMGVAATAFYGVGVGVSPKMAIALPTPLFAPFVGMLIALAVAGAAMGLGAMAGFLFGLPRALTNPDVRQAGNIGVKADPTPATAQDAETDDSAAQPVAIEAERARVAVGKYAINTNLERISDWLTTMIVGLGLANFYNLSPMIEEFGERFVPVFGQSGKVFAIGCGLYFLIFGFLLSYISTRTKLTLLFTEFDNDAVRLARDHASTITRAVRVSLKDSVVDTSTLQSPAMRVALDAAQGDKPGGAGDASLPRIIQQTASDEKVLNTIGNAQRANTRDQVLALANARARSGDADGAVNLYQEIVRSSAFDTKIWLDYASALGLANREALFLDLLPEIRTKGTGSNEADARSNFSIGLLGTLQAHLYDGQYDKSIAAGETLERYSLDGARAPWKHIWMACALGQKHAALVKPQLPSDPVASQDEINGLRDRALSEVRAAIELDPMSKTLLRSLYDPAPSAVDRDLESFKGDPQFDAVFAVDVPQAAL